MKHAGYKLAKTLQIGTLYNEDNPLAIFFKGFPELEQEFLSGNSIIIRPSSEHLAFLENEISERLKTLNIDWKEDYDDEKKEFLKKHNRIVTASFLNEAFEINTFGDQKNGVTVDLIEFYNLLKDSSEIFGLSLIPEIRL